MNSPGGSPVPNADQILMQVVGGKWLSRALGAVAQVGVADAMTDGPVDAATLAARTGTNEDALYRTMRALATVGVFVEGPPRTFALTPMSDLLGTDHPRSRRPMIQWLLDPVCWRSWSHFTHSVRTGEPAFDHEFGAPFFDWMRDHDDTARTFNNAMTGFSAVTGEAVAAAYDFSTVTHLVDVGGGHGTLLAAILRRHPTLKSTLYDLPEVTAGAAASLAARNLPVPTEIVSGSFFDGVPAGADAYIMKAIIHDWGDPQCTTILECCRRAMAPGGRVLICDQVVTDTPDSNFAKLLDLEMLMLTHGGRERTIPEFTALVAGAGLRLHKVVPTRTPYSILECHAA